MSDTTHFLKNYTPYPWHIVSVSLDIDLGEVETRVKTHIVMRKKTADAKIIFLDGKKLDLKSVSLNGTPLNAGDYQLDETGLSIHTTEDDVGLEIVCVISPKKNTSLQGLYVSNGILTTQCEAEGFRSIAFFPDRPDCTAVFECSMTADKKKYPVLLSNGNLVKTTDDGDVHTAVWRDPFAKPSYLFAMVAGDLVYTEDFFRTKSGKNISLKVYSEATHQNRHGFALESLKKSMRWDEDAYGLEYDLDTFMIVAIDDFNFGAMENKGLNIFNSRYILVDDALTTDNEKIQVEAIIAHEYFHNWTGNRVTLKNWFHLTLKEGLTVFRDREFTEDVRLGSVKRIDDVQALMASQFSEDAGPLAHPPIPDSYVDMNNFYTVTVYEKGAEIVRMLRTILGRPQFIEGVARYLSKHDGDSATVEDFVGAMCHVSGENLTQFFRWYYYPGTPHVHIDYKFVPSSGALTLHISQSNPVAEKRGKTDPLTIPLKLGFIGARSHKEMTYVANPELADGLFILTEKQATIEFSGFSESPVLSVNRGFSAPVHVHMPYDAENSALLASFDTDEFNRQQSVKRIVLHEIAQAEINVSAYRSSEILSRVMGRTLERGTSNDYFHAHCLYFPSYAELFAERTNVDPDVLTDAVDAVFNGCFSPLLVRLEKLYHILLNETRGATVDDNRAFAGREFKNTILGIMTRLTPGTPEHALEQYRSSDNITDTYAAMRLVVLFDNPSRDEVRKDFYSRYGQYKPMFYKWCTAVAHSKHEGVFEDIKAIMALPEFHPKNPNCVSAVVGGLVGNVRHFHEKSGAGYQFLKNMILKTDKINPYMAGSGLTKQFKILTSLDAYRKNLCIQCLQEINGTPGISSSVQEIAELILKHAENPVID